MGEGWKRNPDELLARFRKRHDKTPLVAAPAAIIWDIAGAGSKQSAALLIRPWEGELLLSLQTLETAPQALLRRPWLAEEASYGCAPEDDADPA